MASWEPVGSIAVDGFTPAVVVGPLVVPPATERILIRCRDTSGLPVFPYGYGLLSWQSAAGREFGTARVYGHAEWEVVELPVTNTPQETAGQLIFEPRSYNSRWLTAEPAQIWRLEIEAMPVLVEATPQGNRIVETGDRHVIWQDAQGRRWQDCWGTGTATAQGFLTVSYPYPFIEKPTVNVTADNDPTAAYILAPSVVTRDQYDYGLLTCYGYSMASPQPSSWQRINWTLRWRAVGRIAPAAAP